MEPSLELIEILKNLYTISGFRMSVYNTDFQEICAFPQEKSPFCKMIQSCPGGLEHCRSYDKAAFQKVSETGEVYLYRCYFGLYEAAAPLYHIGTLSGYLMMGQTLDTQKTSKNYVISQALNYTTDETALKKAAGTIPIRSKDQILSCISIMDICAAYITLKEHLKTPNTKLPEKVLEYLHRNYSSKISIDDLCSHFYCSRATLTRSFRSAFGKSIHESLTEIRLSHSLKLLKRPDRSIDEIAVSCGFYDQNYFTKVFKKHYKQTPGQWRTQRDPGTE
ncbi:MAG: PocR ligand-binding domain-containing protein [Clostridiaceae bacterium]|nr:PocR ligand-binding domain-containing protein [Clostridiaceae bacterium]